MNQSALNFIFINGRGSSGKDTQADLLLVENPKAIRISTGDIVRGAMTPDGQYGRFYKQIEPYIEQSHHGGLIPDKVILPIVNQIIEEKIAEGKNTFIFTGFPRTEEQLFNVEKNTKSLERQYSNVNVSYICYAVLETHSRRRAGDRRRKAEELSKEVRKDDRPDIVEQRLKEYKEKTAPMLHRLAKEGKLIVIKSSGTIEDIHQRTIEGLKKTTKHSQEGRQFAPEMQRNPHKER
jgi:adenylate kinase